MTPAGYRAAARHLRAVADALEATADATTAQARRRRTQTINALPAWSRRLYVRHARRHDPRTGYVVIPAEAER